jgi:hypothetical protein
VSFVEARYSHCVADRCEGVAQLMTQHSEELVFAAVGFAQGEIDLHALNKISSLSR